MHLVIKKFNSIRRAAHVYDVPRSTLQTRLHGVIPRLETTANSRKLTDTEEEVLINRIFDLDDKGFPPRHSIVREYANLILKTRDASPQPQPVGKNWVTNFIKRHDALRTMYDRKLDYKRAKCEDPRIIEPWFTLIRDLIAKYGILDDDIWNFDETGFQMGVALTTKVITRAEKQSRPKTKQPGNREWVTVVHGINALGWSIPPFIIVKAQNHLAPWYTTDDIPGDWRISTSAKGWTDDQIGFEWLKHFHTHTEHRTKGRYRLLIFDGHGSHHTAQFEEFCRENSIITACMPPHSSHLLQPLDVGCFSPLKASYGRQVENQMRLGINHVDKEDFLGLYLTAHREALSKANIQSGFAATGLVPYNPERVLSTLSLVRTPSPALTAATGSTESTWVAKTPHTMKEIKRQVKYMDVQPTTEFQQLLKGFEIVVHKLAITEAELAIARKANERQTRKRAKRRTVIQKTGSLTIREGQELVYERELAAQIQNEARTRDIALVDEAPKTRAPRKCSVCESLEHTARTCPVRVR